MRRFLFAITTLTLVTVLAAAQSTQEQTTDPSASQQTAPAQQPMPTKSATAPNPTPSSAPMRIAAGSVIPVQLAKTIDAKKAKTGDEVIAKVTMDMKSNSGAVLVPKDTKVIGHVTEAQARNKEQKESELGIAFDHAVTKTGEMQMPMSIQAIIAPQDSNPNNTGGSATGAPATASAPTSAGSGMSPSANRSAGEPIPMPADNGPTNTDTGVNARPRITASTQGVIGISGLNLAAAPNATQGSLMSSDKNNVKLESGTLMLLKVNR